MNTAELTNNELIDALIIMRDILGLSRTEREVLAEACNRIAKLDRVERWIVEQTVKPQMRKVFNGCKE